MLAKICQFCVTVSLRCRDVDRNSVVLLAEDGRTVFTNLIYPPYAKQRIAFQSAGAAGGAEPAPF